ncbi:hypothetical protein ACIBCC_35155 [Streptomyces griseus]|uniref:hypothetical protein n=1 Tax=Streptomyces griseus TaxID=1911 RepID=UPI00379B6EC6
MSADMVAARTADDMVVESGTDTDVVVESGTGTVVDIATRTPANTGTDTVETEPRPVVGTLRQVLAVLPLRRALPDLVSGSWVLAGMGCGCVARVLRWAWDQASDDPTAAAQLAAYTKGAQAVEKVEGEEERAAALAALGAAPSGRRPALEALAYLALGGMLAAGALATVAALATPHLVALAEWRLGILAAAGLGWSVAAWSVAPPPPSPKAATELVDDGQGDAAEEDTEAARGAALLVHVITALSDAETVGRAGVHLDVVLQSAIAAGLLAPDTELPVLRAWVEATGLPTVDKLGYRIEGRPVTRIGLRVDGATGVLGATPTAWLDARFQPLAGGGPTAPAQPVGETPATTPTQPPAEAAPTTPASTPVPAALRLIPGGRQHPDQTPSPTVPQRSAQEAR